MRRHGLTAFNEPVAVYIDFRLKPPPSMSNRKRAAMLAGEVGTTGRYDIDNLAKAILDAMNKVAFKDDRLICRLRLEKVASETVGVDVTVESYAQARSREREQQADVGGDLQWLPGAHQTVRVPGSGRIEYADGGNGVFLVRSRPELGEP